MMTVQLLLLCAALVFTGFLFSACNQALRVVSQVQLEQHLSQRRKGWAATVHKHRSELLLAMRGKRSGTDQQLLREVMNTVGKPGRLGGQIQCLEILGQEFAGETPFIQTIFSPTSQLKYLAGKDRVLVEMRTHRAAVEKALQAITETTIRFLEAMKQTGVDGIFFAVQLATPHDLTRGEYECFGRSYDLQILEAAADLFWFNLLHLHGQDAYFDLVADYPVAAINWHDRESRPTLAEARQQFAGGLVGGLRQWDTMLHGTPEDVRCEAADAIAQTDGRGFILGTGCVTPITAPWGNLRAVRQAVEIYG